MHIDQAGSLWHPGCVYLNTASFGLPPDPGWEAHSAALDDWRSGRTSWEGWGEHVAKSRAAFARLVGVEEGDVACSATVSQLAGLVAGALPDGAEVLCPEEDFTSAIWPFMVHEGRGVKVRTVPLRNLPDEIRPTTTLVSFSTVQSSDGRLVDLEGVVEAARANETLTFVDATQSVGWLPVDAARFDYLTCAAYKWLMAPRGSVFMYVRRSLLDDIPPAAAGWFAGDEILDSYYGPPLRLSGDARRLDTSPAWFSWVGTTPALELLLDIGVEAIHEHNVALANRFLAGRGLPPGPSAIVTVDAPEAAAALEAANVRAAVRAGKVRASFHLYNTEADVDAALGALEEVPG